MHLHLSQQYIHYIAENTTIKVLLLNYKVQEDFFNSTHHIIMKFNSTIFFDFISLLNRQISVCSKSLKGDFFQSRFYFFSCTVQQCSLLKWCLHSSHIYILTYLFTTTFLSASTSCPRTHARTGNVPHLKKLPAILKKENQNHVYHAHFQMFVCVRICDGFGTKPIIFVLFMCAS